MWRALRPVTTTTATPCSQTTTSTHCPFLRHNTKAISQTKRVRTSDSGETNPRRQQGAGSFHPPAGQQSQSQYIRPPATLGIMLRTTLLRHFSPLLHMAAVSSGRAGGRAGREMQTLQRTFATRATASVHGGPRAQILRNTARTTKSGGGQRPFSGSSRRKEGLKTEARGAKPAAEPEPTGLSARLKKLSREYGWSAVGVYFALSVLDFPFCFLLVQVVGTERIGALEHWIMGYVKQAIPDSVEEWWRNYRQSVKKAEIEKLGSDDITEHIEMAGWGVEEAERMNDGPGASLGTQLALAYAIHKSFIFIRVPLTAAVTPKVVKKLRSWGWDIGKRRNKKPASSTIDKS
ncbi:N-terminal acetyltransferase 2 [Microdochium nivale]|nr:N-terminal acetyltransferase 2 [Microdochium nivale]